MTRVTIDQHLAWPETRIQHLITWLNRPIQGWDNKNTMQRFYYWVALAEDHEAHF